MSKTNIKSFLGKVRSVIKGNKALDQIKMIKMLNPMIQGWSNFHQHNVAKVVYVYVDHEI